MAKIIWHRTGDELNFIPCHPEMFDYYLQHINDDGVNKFSVTRDFIPRDDFIKLRRALDSCFELSSKIPFDISDWHSDLLDQAYLNQLHREWVKTGQKYPKIILLLKHLGKDKDFRDINTLLHNIETNFRIEFSNYTIDPYQIKNPFGPGLLDFQGANIFMEFDNLGRSTWDKFINRDCNVHDSDTNDQTMLSGKITINLYRPLSTTVPIEYVEWCNNMQLPVMGRFLRVGNLVGLDKSLLEIRHIFMRNTNEPSDTFFFESRS